MRASWLTRGTGGEVWKRDEKGGGRRVLEVLAEFLNTETFLTVELWEMALVPGGDADCPVGHTTPCPRPKELAGPKCWR